MKMRNIIFAAVLVLVYQCHSRSVSAQELGEYTIRAGTLEIEGQTYIFRTGNIVEKYDVSLLGIAQESGVTPAGIPGPKGLLEAGFVSTGGAIYNYGDEIRSRVLARAAKERPSETVAKWIFVGMGGHRVMINAKGKTEVYRVDMRISGWPVILWSNVENSLPVSEKDKKSK